MKRPARLSSIPHNYYVYRIEGDGNATRYGANVGRAGFLWSGEAYVGRKAEWPVWTPPKEMIQRQPEARKYAGGMPGGLDNPLGARTLYLYQNGVYTLYTIYSTSDPEIDRDQHYERLHRPPQSGYARPLCTNAGQDEGNRSAGLGDGVSPQPRRRERTIAIAGAAVTCCVSALCRVERPLPRNFPQKPEASPIRGGCPPQGLSRESLAAPRKHKIRRQRQGADFAPKRRKQAAERPNIPAAGAHPRVIAAIDAQN